MGQPHIFYNTIHILSIGQLQLLIANKVAHSRNLFNLENNVCPVSAMAEFYIDDTQGDLSNWHTRLYKWL